MGLIVGDGCNLVYSLWLNERMVDWHLNSMRGKIR